tara:strand:- start:1279 stop:2277 length:999 start_codon:yes stop_codon:yes gene_type:complete
MAEFYANSGSAAGSVGPLTRLASEFVPMLEESRIGHLIGARVPFQTPSTLSSYLYHGVSMYTDASGINKGQRLVGQPVPLVEPGKYSVINAQLVEYGEMSIIDKADGYAFGDAQDLDRDEAGIRMSLTHCLDALDKRASEVLTASSTPWTTADFATSSGSGGEWGTTTNDPFTDIMAALDAYESTVGVPMPFGKISMIIGSKTFRDLAKNPFLTSLWGGANAGLGALTPDQIRQSLASVGISEVLYGSDARYSSYCSLYVKNPGGIVTTPGGRLSEAAGIITPHSGSELIQVDEDQTPYMVDPRRMGYLAFANCEPCCVLPDFGVRITGVSA